MRPDGRRRTTTTAVLALAAVVIVVLAASSVAWWSPAAQGPARATATTLQGERLRVATGSGHVVRDASASGHRVLLLDGGTAARGRARVRVRSRLSVIARRAGCAGVPRIVVSVDGTRVLSGAVRSVRRWTTLRGAPIVRAGARTVSVRLLNPRRTARCRRGVRLDRLVFTAAPAPAAPLPAPAAPAPTAPAVWVPAAGISWQWQLTGPLDLSVDAALYDVDLFDTTAAAVAELHARGRHVVCYLDAGTYEPGRPDAGAFPDAVLGAGVEGWPGERWLDIRRLDVLRPILEHRMDLCRDKGFDGVEPDNVDAYANTSGFALSAADQLAFNRFLAAGAHARGLSVGLKNDLDQVAALEPDFDWALDEQCFQYRECDALQPFARAGKAVLIAEYETEPPAFCPPARAAGYSAIRKHLELDAWRQAC
jgi:hypothetical protein